ncbi:MAG: SIMPL domain-containing protein [Paludibacteraceae bacterium]|nr:SIMPL domain-containing protein [Paludibacteraceae bacterium]
MNKPILSSIILAIGLALAGLFVYCGIHQIASKDRVVSVKGLSTRDVQADFVVWPLDFCVRGNDISALYDDMARIEKTAKAFFLEKGFKESELARGNISIDDNWSSYYGARPEFHYTLRTSFIISTPDIDRVKANLGCQSELLKKGVILQSYEWNTDFQYNGLPDLKPEMVQEATQNARQVAQKFAEDAQCRLGSIQHANQGQFSIESDNYQPWIKHVRVVTTVSYYLK